MPGIRGDSRPCESLPTWCVSPPWRCCPAVPVGPDFEHPTPWWARASWRGTGQPQAQAVSQPVAEPVDPQWWTLFNDKQLTSLEQRLAEANLDVRAASIRLAEARAAMGVAAAAGLPSVNGNASYTRQQLSEKGALSLISTGTAASQSNGASQAQNGAEVPNVGIFQPFNLFQYRLRCLVGGRYLGPGAPQRRVGRRQRGRQ